MFSAMVLAAAEEADRPLSNFFYNMREAGDLAVGGNKTRRSEICLSRKIAKNVPRVI